jgi:hypothetical protein
VVLRLSYRRILQRPEASRSSLASVGSTGAGTGGRRGLRRDRPCDFSMKSTKVQSFDDAITGAKRPQSLNSTNRTNRGSECRKSDTPSKGLSSAPLPMAVTARLAWGPKHSPSGSRKPPPVSRYLSTRETSGRSFCALQVRLMSPLARRTPQDQWRGPRAYSPNEPRKISYGARRGSMASC